MSVVASAIGFLRLGFAGFREKDLGESAGWNADYRALRLRRLGHLEDFQPQVPAPLIKAEVARSGPIGRPGENPRSLNHAQ
jgi:hypothetical protein